VHGAHDTNVPLYEAEQVVMALADRNLPYEYVLFRDEGHDILKKANQAFFVQKVGDWLAKHLDVTARGDPVTHADAV
jgi:dipeptidyl aminopeptidase/acylaminoacyl peptidase